MDPRRIDVEDVKSVFKEVGIAPEECDRCMKWTSPELDKPLTKEDKILAELTREEQGFFRCMGYVAEAKVIDTLQLRALYQTFWNTVRGLHDLPAADLTIKGGKYIVAG
jgi:hypothetical protein